MRNKIIFLALFCIVAAAFQNCVFQNTSTGSGSVDSSGTTVSNPLQPKTYNLRFGSFNSQISGAQLCLTNVLFKFQKQTPISNLAPLANSGFEQFYFYYDSNDSSYYINALLDHVVQLHPNGTTIGTFTLPAGSYERVVFGFSTCSGGNLTSQPSLIVQNSNGSFTDQSGRFFTLEYNGALDLMTPFPINFLTDSLASVASPSDLATVLQPYRQFDLIGFTSTSLAGMTNVQMHTLANQASGKTIAVGSASSSGNLATVVVTRYGTDGFIDSSFGNTLVTNGVTSVVANESVFNGLGATVAPDDSIYVVTTNQVGASGDQIAVLKLDPNGNVVTSYGTNGWVYIDTGSNLNYGKDALALPDGSLYAVGVSSSHNLVVAKITANGQLDSTFGTNGLSQTPYTSYNYFDKIRIKRQGDGKLLLSGTANTNNGPTWMLLRLNSDGSPDSSFASGSAQTGVQLITFGDSRNNAFANDHLIQPDGSIVVVGQTISSNNNYKFAAVRLLADGTLDSNFATGGIFTYSFGNNDIAQSCILNNLNQIIIGGSSTGSQQYNFAVLALTPSGQINSSNSSPGYRIFSLNPGAVGSNLLLAPNGSTYFGGSDNSSFNLLTIAN